MINVTGKVTSNIDLNKFFQVVITETGKTQLYIQRHAEVLSQEVAIMIANEIELLHPIGEFMAPRTQIDVKLEGSTIQFEVHGKTESEVNDSYTARWLAESYTQRMGDWHLWEFTEFGGNTGTITMPQELYPLKFKGDDETVVYAYHREGVDVTKYKGRVRVIITSLKEDIKKYLQARVALLAEENFVNGVIKGSGNQIRPKIDSKELLKKLQVSPSFLKKNNITMSTDSLGRTYFREAGQIISKSKVAKLRILK